jgi:NADP-dependent 3-hydroxy acid dehydrogenase YdfG
MLGKDMAENKGNAIIIGASSGIGEALARLFMAQGYKVGGCARRTEMLAALRTGRHDCFVKQMDVSRPDEAMALFRELVSPSGSKPLAFRRRL